MFLIFRYFLEVPCIVTLGKQRYEIFIIIIIDIIIIIIIIIISISISISIIISINYYMWVWSYRDMTSIHPYLGCVT